MKRLTIILVTVFICSLLWGQPEHYELIFWDFQNTLEPEEVNEFIADVSDIETDEHTTISFMNGNDGQNTRIGVIPDRFWTTDENIDPNNLPEKYIEYTFRPKWNYAVHLREFQFRLGRNELGPRAIVGQYSLDGFEETASHPFWIAQDIESEDPNSLDFFRIDFQGAALRFQGPNVKFTLRMYPIGAIEDEDDQIDPDDSDTWPALMINNFRVTGYVVPFPSIALALDRSGSMGTENYGAGYWNAARQRAQVFVGNIMRNLDAVSVVTYNVENLESVDWEDHSEVVLPMRWPDGKLSILWPIVEIPDTTVQRVYIIDQIDELDDPVGRTSIGSGLIAAREELLEASTVIPGKAAIVLLSDGFDNWNPMARHVIPDLMPASISVFSITLGSIADANLMRWIARETGGEWFHSPNEDMLIQIYWHIYLMGLNRFRISSASYENIAANERHVRDVIVDEKMGQVTFHLVTEEEDIRQQTTAIDFTLISPSGQAVDPLFALETTGITYSETFAGKKYEIFLPEKGVWQYVVSGNDIPEEENYFAVAYGTSSIKVEIDTREEEYFVEEPIVFEARLSDGDDPITSAQVRALVFPASEDTRNRSYSNVEGTPFADYEPEKTINTRFEQTRNSDGIELDFIEAEPGIYRGVYDDTAIAGPYNIKLVASVDNEEYHFKRHAFLSTLVSPPQRVPIPHLSQPADGAEGLGTDIKFVWNDVLNADSYRFQLATRHAIIIDIEGIEDNFTVIDTLDYDTYYTWRVKAFRGENDGFWSPIWSLKTGIPEIPIPVGLQDALVDDAVELSWDAVSPVHQYYGDLYGYILFRNDDFLTATNESTTQYKDRNILPGNSYTYYVKSVYDLVERWTSEPSNMVEIRFTGIQGEGDIPAFSRIKGNFPNPFNPETTIMFALSEPGYTEISVYNIAGQKVRTLVRERLDAGNHSVVWNALDERDNPATSGIYMIKMETENYSGHSKVLLLK